MWDIISVGGNDIISFLYLITPTDISLPLISSSINALSSSLKQKLIEFIIFFLSSTLDIPKLDPPALGLINTGSLNFDNISSIS